ncbi:MAG: hypothetical protein PHX05_10380 [Acidobacteriota bacterium]|nr:hypothetical protein [Acidobacteriota bacterium]
MIIETESGDLVHMDETMDGRISLLTESSGCKLCAVEAMRLALPRLDKQQIAELERERKN